MKKILVVDDSRSVHAVVKSFLSRVPGVEISGVANGMEAVELLKKGNVFDLILLDWEMPILDGPGSLNAFKEMGSKIPVLMMTTKNSAEDILKMLESGVAEYMMKPFTGDILCDKISQVLKESFHYAA